MNLTHYQVLGVDHDAPADVIVRAYHDRVADLAAEELELAVTEGGTTPVDEAFAVLSDPRLRAAYDAALRQEAATNRAVTQALLQANVHAQPDAVSERDRPRVRGAVRSLVLLWLLTGLAFTMTLVWGAPAWAVAGSLVVGWLAVTVLAAVAIVRVSSRSPLALVGYGVALAVVVATGVRYAGSVSPVSLGLLGAFVVLYVVAAELAAWQSRGEVNRNAVVEQAVAQYLTKG